MIVLEALDPRTMAWNLEALTSRVCPFCTTDNEAVLKRPDQLPVAYCTTCGCWYVAQIPPVDEIRKFYDGYWHVHHPTDLSSLSGSQILEVAQRTSKRNWQLQTLSRLLGGLRGKRVLEVGCGKGQFLLSARSEGADVVGCDLSPEACHFVKGELDISIYQSELHQCSAAIGNVDVIVMRELIEHPVEPMNTVDSAYSILKPGGVLLLQTPNAGEAGTDIESGRQWVGFRVDLEHLQYLTPRTVNWLARMRGMSIERLNAFGFPGLKGLRKIPSTRSGARTIRQRVRDIAKRIPCGQTIVRSWRAVQTEVMGGNFDPRMGSYHLYAVLRKM